MEKKEFEPWSCVKNVLCGTVFPWVTALQVNQSHAGARTRTEKVSTVLMKLDDDGVEGNYKLQENVCMCVRACTFNMCVCVSIIKKERNASPSPSHLLLYSSVFWWPWQPADEKILGVHLIEAMGRHEVRTDWKDSGMEREQDEGRGLAEWTLCWVISREWEKNVTHSDSLCHIHFSSSEMMHLPSGLLQNQQS